MIGLYDVYVIYGGDRDNPIVRQGKRCFAMGEEAAKIKSGAMKLIDDDWDTEYVSVIVECICTAKVKPKPAEVKNV